MKRPVILYIAASLDGYIAAPGDDLSFLDAVQKEGEDYGYAAFTSTVDTVIMGRRTYEWITSQVDFPHSDKNSFIITRTPRPSIGNITFYGGDIKELIVKLKTEEGGTIFCDGGAEVVHSLLEEKLIDTIILSIIPVLLGNGIRLFKEGRPLETLKLKESKSFDTGLVQLTYEVMK